jgi:hypothetical protein
LRHVVDLDQPFMQGEGTGTTRPGQFKQPFEGDVVDRATPSIVLLKERPCDKKESELYQAGIEPTAHQNLPGFYPCYGGGSW